MSIIACSTVLSLKSPVIFTLQSPNIITGEEKLGSNASANTMERQQRQQQQQNPTNNVDAWDKILLILDEQGSMIKQDAYFYPLLKKYCSFQDLCDSIKVTDNLGDHVDKILIYFGHGLIHQLGPNQIKQCMQKLLARLLVKCPKAHIFISTLVPSPVMFHITSLAYLRYNEAIMKATVQWIDNKHPVTLLPSHVVFVHEARFLDEKSGLFKENYNYHVDITKEFSKGKLSISGWFKLHSFWLQETRMVQVDDCLTTDWGR